MHLTRLALAISVSTALLSASSFAALEHGDRQDSATTPQRPQGAAPLHDAFGFHLGEQRRYALGPPSILRAGEFETWTLRLDEILDDPRGALYTFTYSRELSLVNERNPGVMDNMRAQMTVTVNHHGFPVDVRYGSRDRDASRTDWVNKNGRLRWMNGRFFFETPDPADQSDFSFGLLEHDDLDLSIPSGLFLSETENPSLITLTAAIFQATGVTEMEFLALRPNRIGAQGMRRRGSGGRGGGGGGGRGGGGGGGRGGGGGGGRGRGGLRNPGQRNDVVRASLEFEAIETIELGGRTYEAIRLDSSESTDDVFIRSDGALLRVDIAFRNRRNAHVRLLHPSEY